MWGKGSVTRHQVGSRNPDTRFDRTCSSARVYGPKVTVVQKLKRAAASEPIPPAESQRQPLGVLRCRRTDARRSEAAPGEGSGSDARVHPLPSSRARPASRESAGGADRCFRRRKAGGVVALLDELPSLDEGGRTAYDPALMILLSACTLHARYGLSGTDKRCSTSELGDAIVHAPGTRIKGASSRPCDARSLSWRVRNRSCIVVTTHRNPDIRPAGCTHPTGSIRAWGRGGNRDVPRIGRNARGSASS